MQLISVEIKGTYALLQHRFGPNAEAGLAEETRTVKKKVLTAREEAEMNCYRAKDGTLYHPSSAILSALCEAGSEFKQKGSRKNLKFLVPAAVRMMDDIVPLFDGSGKPAKDFEIDSRRVVNKNTKGAIIANRPRLDEWFARFDIKVFDDVIDPDTVHTLLVRAGERIGIGAFRPVPSKGPFGVFAVTKWAENKPSNGKVAKDRVPELAGR